MAWDGGDFTREDVYMLFVATRIVNFLNSRRESSRRTAVGEKLLDTLVSTGKLFVANGSERKPLPRFQSDLFFELWRELGYVTRLDGERIEIPRNAVPTFSMMPRRSG